MPLSTFPASFPSGNFILYGLFLPVDKYIIIIIVSSQVL